MTIPSEMLKLLQAEVGAQLDVRVTDGALTARPATPARRLYSLRELLRGATPRALPRLNEETAWARKGDPVGREL